MTAAIRTHGLTKRFRRQSSLLDLVSRRGRPDTLAVDDITLDVKPGEIFGLLGPNGAGKTTFIKLLSTLLLPSSGQAAVYGQDVVRDAHRVRQFVGLAASEERSFFWRLTGRQNLQFFAALYRLPRRQAASRIAELFELLDLNAVADVRFNEYSTGMRQKLAIARGLLSQPKVLFMDEPTKGLDPVSAQALLKLIRHTLVDVLGSTIVLTTHILRDVEQLCDRVALINRGRLLACGTLEELRLSSRQYHRYRLKVTGLSEQSLHQLAYIPGLLKYSRLSGLDGIVEVGINLRKDSCALSETLRHLLRNRCQILSCTLEEERLEEIITHLLRAGGTPSPPTEEPAPWSEQLLRS